MNEIKRQLKLAKLKEQGPAKANPHWRTHVSLFVEANKRDVWDLVSQWDKKELWFPAHQVESTEDMPVETYWLHDKKRVLKLTDQDWTLTEGLCEELTPSRHVTADFLEPHGFPFLNYVYTLKITAWSNHETVVDWVSNYTIDLPSDATQAQFNEKASEIHALLTDMALGCQFRQGDINSPVASMRLRNSLTEELYGGYHAFDLLDTNPVSLSQTAVEYEQWKQSQAQA